MPITLDFSGKLVLVTGGGRGIGAAISKALAKGEWASACEEFPGVFEIVQSAQSARSARSVRTVLDDKSGDVEGTVKREKGSICRGLGTASFPRIPRLAAV